MQVQVQMLVTESESSIFCVSTTATSDNLHCEEICFDPMYVEELVFKATIFISKIIAPELLTGRIKLQMEKEKVGIQNLLQMWFVPCLNCFDSFFFFFFSNLL